jgi:ribokinase
VRYSANITQQCVARVLGSAEDDMAVGLDENDRGFLRQAERFVRGALHVIDCVDAAPYRTLSEELTALVDLLVVNALEAEQLSGIAVIDLASAAKAAEELAARFPAVVVTAGGEGVAGLKQGGAAIILPALPVTLVSTHGAGDAFVGALVASLAAGCTFDESLQAANAAAAAHVSRRAATS